MDRLSPFLQPTLTEWSVLKRSLLEVFVHNISTDDTLIYSAESSIFDSHLCSLSSNLDTNSKVVFFE